MSEETKNLMGENQQETHLLHSKWVTWIRDRADGNSEEFEESLNKLCVADSLETFFTNYIHMKRPDEIETNTDIFMFREKEMPMWEKCPNGCTLIIKINRENLKLNLYWEKLLFMCVGEALEDLNIIGVALSLRRNNCALLEIWNKDINKSPDNETKTK